MNDVICVDFYDLLFYFLHFYQAAVKSVLADEAFMRAPFNNFSFLQNYNFIGMADRT